MNAKLTVRLTSGREEAYDFDVKAGGRTAEVILKEFAKDPTLLMQTEEEWIIIPAAAIEKLTLTLPPDKREQLALPNVRRVKRLDPPS